MTDKKHPGENPVLQVLAKVQNFKLLPVFVLVSMGLGIAIGRVYGISNFSLARLRQSKRSFAASTFSIFPIHWPWAWSRGSS